MKKQLKSKGGDSGHVADLGNKGPNMHDPLSVVKQFDQMWEQGEPFICYLHAAKNDVKDKKNNTASFSWSPDCDAVEHLIIENILGKTKLKIVQGVVETKAAWDKKTKKHAFKTHKII